MMWAYLAWEHPLWGEWDPKCALHLFLRIFFGCEEALRLLSPPKHIHCVSIKKECSLSGIFKALTSRWRIFNMQTFPFVLCCCLIQSTAWVWCLQSNCVWLYKAGTLGRTRLMLLFINRSALEGSFTIPLQDSDPSLSSGYLDIHKQS